MKRYRVTGNFEGKAYLNLLSFAVENSDCFGFSTFKDVHKKDLEQSYFDFLKYLAPFERDTAQYELRQHYRRGQKIHIYAVSDSTYDELSKVNGLYDWRLFNYPEDLSFYYKGRVWFNAISHEKLCLLYTDSQKIISGLENLGYEVIEEKFYK